MRPARIPFGASPAGAAALTLMLWACAGDLPRGEAPIRTGDRDEGIGADGSFDARVPDMGPDMAPPGPGPRPSRAVWVVERVEGWADGLRARLRPSHAPLGIDPMDALPAAAVLVRWSGPADPATERLLERGRSSRETGVLYALGDRISALDPGADPETAAIADVSWLAARFTDAALVDADGPVIVVDAHWGAASRGALAAMKARLEALGVSITWAVIVDPAETDPPPAHIVVPRCDRYDAGARSRGRQRALDAGRRWMPCVAPPINPRLDVPGALADDPSPSTLARRLVLARRAGSDTIIVDGVGGWRDDRQLDPVGGEPTGAPLSLTTALTYRGYGTERVDAVHRLLRSPASLAPGALAEEPVLLELLRTAGVFAERLEHGPEGIRLTLRDQTGSGRYEVLIDDRPFIVPPNARLRYRRSDVAVAIDLVFEGGERLVDLLPDPGDAPGVEVRLDPFEGARVEEVTLIYRGGRNGLDALIERPVIAVSPL